MKKTLGSLMLLAILVGPACCIAQAEEFSYSGYREDTNQACQISFEIDETGTITHGIFHLNKACGEGIYLAGGDLYFSGQKSSLGFDGSGDQCSGVPTNECGYGKIWYDPSWGVVLQLTSTCTYGTANYIFKNVSNPFRGE
jgi:hypothetical protein